MYHGPHKRDRTANAQRNSSCLPLYARLHTQSSQFEHQCINSTKLILFCRVIHTCMLFTIRFALWGTWCTYQSKSCVLGLPRVLAQDPCSLRHGFRKFPARYEFALNHHHSIGKPYLPTSCATTTCPRVTSQPEHHPLQCVLSFRSHPNLHNFAPSTLSSPTAPGRLTA